MKAKVVVEGIMGTDPRIYVEDPSYKTEARYIDGFVKTYLDKDHIRKFDTLEAFVNWMKDNDVDVEFCRRRRNAIYTVI